MSKPAAQKEIASIKNREETAGAETDRSPPMAPSVPTQALPTSRTRTRRHRKKTGDLVAGQPSEGRVVDDSHSSSTAETPTKRLQHSSARTQNRENADLEAAGNDGNGNGNENTTSGLQASRITSHEDQGDSDDDQDSALIPGATRIGGFPSPQTDGSENDDSGLLVAEPSDRDEEDPLEANVSMDPPQIVAELAPDEADVEARIAERLERQWNDRLKQEVLEAHLIVEAVTLPKSSDGQDGPNAASMSGAPVDNNVKVCGLRRRQTWGFLLLIVLILVGGGIAGGVIYLQSHGDGGGDGSTNPPSLRPTLPPTDAANENMEYLLEQLRDRIAPTNADFAQLEDATTPQFQALAWLANEDQYARFPEMVATTELLERYVLAVLYFSTDGPNWNSLNEFLEPRTACQWNFFDNDTFSIFGVSCDRVSNRDSVRDLRMHDLGMFGTIPWELSLLENLKLVYLSNNRLSGPIPFEFGVFTNLSFMWLDGNFLTGPLPSDLPSSMESLALGRNLFTGTLPGNWGEGLPDLSLLSLQENSISGTLPGNWGEGLPDLRFLLLGSNQIEGTLPPSWGNMTDLAWLDLHENSISGTLPGNWGEGLPDLSLLSLGSNRIEGTLPPFWGNMGNLVNLYLQENSISGTLPGNWGEGLPDLSGLSLGSNRIEGTLPPSWGNMTNLVNLFLHENSISGSIPSEYGSLGNLTSLYLNSNFLTGSLPTELGQLDLLRRLDVFANLELMGTIPTEFMLMSNLDYFWFHNTSLTGSVNETLCALSVPPADMKGDCLDFEPEIQCSCCTSCCTRNGKTCELMVV